LAVPENKVQESVRLVDVAAAAGVAVATASRALHNPGRVSAKTRDKVAAEAQRLGYSFNVAARQLRSGQSRIIMAVMPPRDFSSILEEIVAGIVAELSRAQYGFIVCHLNADRSADPRVLELLRGGLVDGLIAIANSPSAMGDMAVVSAQLPTVGVMIDLSEYGIPSVITDDAAAVSELTSSLVAEGHSYIAYLSGLSGGLGGFHDQERYAGFMQAAARVRTCRIEGDFTFASGEKAADWYLAQTDRPSAIVCANDNMAVALLDKLRRQGIRIPEDVAITGFDDIDAGKYCSPALTTIQPPVADIGATSARLLLQLISGAITPDRQARIVSGRIVRRGSF
jgi:LacI family repressor for deo operon, udp, cdd, tsx, nupC, and nupG